ARPGSNQAGSATCSLSNQTLNAIMPSKNQASSPVMSIAARKMPANLPSKKWRRETGLLITVTAVRPSISSLIDMLAATTEKTTAASMIVSKPSSRTILTSSPKVKYGMNGAMTMSSTAPTTMTQNSGWRTPSRNAARATAPPWGQSNKSSGKSSAKKS